MQKTEPLKKINKCLIKYVENSNLKYKRSISSVYMNKRELQEFYNDMADDTQTKYHKIRHQRQSEKSKTHWKHKKPKKPFNAHEQMEIIPINHNNFFVENTDPEPKDLHNLKNFPQLQNQISVIQHDKFQSQFESYLQIQHSKVKASKMKKKYKGYEEEIDKADVKMFKKVEQQKYINKFRVKQKKPKVQVEVVQPNSPVKKRNKQLDALFKKFFTQPRRISNEKNVQEMKEEVGKKVQVKQSIFHTIEDYFVKKRGTHPFQEFQ